MGDDAKKGEQAGFDVHERRVIVRLHEHAAPRELTRAAAQSALPLAALQDKFPGVRVEPMVTSINPEQLTELVERAQRLDPTYRPPNFLGYLVIRCPLNVDAEDVAGFVRASPAVELAYVEAGPTPPPVVNAADDPRQGNQGYEDAAPAGVNAEYAWTVAGGDGTGVRFVDLEQGWTLNHEDLQAAGITLISGTNQAYFGHGTAVLGEVRAVDNTVGDVGIAPACTTQVVSQFQPGGYSTPNAILSALTVLAFGDVLLLEAQTTVAGSTYLPVEVEQATYDAIRLGTALGIVVVEAGGNGSNDLDTWTDGGGNTILDRGSAAFRDSGAIMVGAASSTVPHTRLGFSNFGSRIDCYGWGQNVDTAGDGWTGNLTTTYTMTFGGTSSASPIVAGAAVAVQGAAVAAGFRYSPLQIRQILSSNGTASGNPAADRIGVLPNLQQILQNVLGVGADVYVRDFVGDNGAPHTGPISASPDVILLQNADPNPQASFGQGSGTENSNTLGDTAEAGQDNYLYVRVLDRGGSAATNVTATVYWSPPATLPTPNLWTLVGSTVLANVPAGNQLTVSNAIVWPAAQIPAPGHYCFVALLDATGDPAPPLAALLNWANFERFIRENNNVTWRNFNVVNNVPPAAGAGAAPPGYVALPFLVVGAPKEAVEMELEVIARLPRGARVLLAAPAHAFDALRIAGQRGPLEKDPKRQVIAVNPHGDHRVARAVFPADARFPFELFVQIPKAHLGQVFEVAARQLFKGREVGRITWLLVPADWSARQKERQQKRAKA